MSNIIFLTMSDLCSLFKVGRATINRWNNPRSTQFKANFPQPFKASRSPLWDKNEIERFIETEKKARDERITEHLRYRQEVKQHHHRVRETLFKEQKTQREQIYIRPPKGDRLAAHTLRKLQAFGLQ